MGAVKMIHRQAALGDDQLFCRRASNSLSPRVGYGVCGGYGATLITLDVARAVAVNRSVGNRNSW